VAARKIQELALQGLAQRRTLVPFDICIVSSALLSAGGMKDLIRKRHTIILEHLDLRDEL
jgi:hypothetical protein